jgi:hypothetical protein
MNKTVSSVIDDINESIHPQYGTTYYVTCMFTDDTVGSAGKKKYEYALELQGLLREAIGVEQEFTLESQGQTKTGRDKFKILGFGTPGGAATYTAPGVQGSGSGVGGPVSSPRGGRSPEPSLRIVGPETYQPDTQQASIRASVALKAAVKAMRLDINADINKVLEYADAFNAWMLEKTSEPLSEEPGSLALNDQAGGSEPSDSARASEPTLVGAESESAGSQGSPEGEAGDPVPHQHDWQPHKSLHGWLSCSCGENRKKYAP